jgi:hypothetical protein
MRFLKAKTQFVCFAPIDLQQAILYVRDGWGNQTGVATVTNSAEEPALETVVALTNCGLVVPVGCTVHFANDSTDTEYFVGSRTTSGGTNAVFTLFFGGATAGNITLTYLGATTNSIPYDATAATITLELEALDTIGNGDVAVVGSADRTITFQDDLASTVVSVTDFVFADVDLAGATGEGLTLTTPGVPATATATITLTAGLAEVVEISGAVTFTGQLLEVKIGEGNANYTETADRVYIKNRGLLDTVRNGDEVPVDVSFDFVWEYITGVSASALPTLEDVLKQTGEASAWVSTSTDTCESYCVDLEIQYDPDCGGNNSETVTLPYFRYEKLDHNLRDSQISCTGKCNVTKATSVRGS